MTRPAGWYGDPEYPGHQRYWDGQQWADQGAPKPAPNLPPGPAAPQAATYATVDELKQSSSINGKVLLIVGGVIAALFAVGGIVATVDGDGGSPDTTTPSPEESEVHSSPAGLPQWKAEVTDTEVVNSSTVRMFVRVENVGNGPASPRCTLRIQDPSYHYHGSTVVTLNDAVKPDHFTNFRTNVIVTSQGASFAKRSSVKCHSRPPVR